VCIMENIPNSIIASNISIKRIDEPDNLKVVLFSPQQPNCYCC